MTDSLANVVIPYSRFRQCQERRLRIAAESIRERPPTGEAAVVPGKADSLDVLDAAVRAFEGAFLVRGVSTAD